MTLAALLESVLRGPPPKLLYPRPLSNAEGIWLHIGTLQWCGDARPEAQNSPIHREHSEHRVLRCLQISIPDATGICNWRWQSQTATSIRFRQAWVPARGWRRQWRVRPHPV